MAYAPQNLNFSGEDLVATPICATEFQFGAPPGSVFPSSASPHGILLLGLWHLHPRIPPIPSELLIRDPLAKDRPAVVQCDLKESAYMNETKHNWMVIKNYENCLR